MRLPVLRVASLVVGVLPFPIARAVGRFGGRVAARRPGHRRRIATRHQARILHGDPTVVDAAVEARVTEVFAGYGGYVAEALWLRRRRVGAVRRRLVMEGTEHFLAALDAGRGLVLALPHIGNWEYAAAYALGVGTRLVAVAEDLPDPAATRWFVEMRGQVGIEVELAGTDRHLLTRLARVLGENEAVALVSDRAVTGSGVATEFFGEVTLMPGGPAALARATGAALLPVACYQTSSGHRCVIEPPVEVPRTQDRQADVATATAELARRFEGLIRADPGQWHVLQPQWPSDPGWQWGEVG